jgi:hypothetical protein
VHKRGNVRLDFKGKVRYEGWKEGVESDTFVLVSGVKVEKTAKIDLVWDKECFQGPQL